MTAQYEPPVSSTTISKAMTKGPILHKLWSIKILILAATIAVGVCGSFAQTAITTSGGTSNTVPKFSGAATLTNSVITESSGKIGIATINPLYPLDVSGTIALKGIPIADTTQIATPTDGTYVIASGSRIHGEYILTFEGASAEQTVHLLASANAYDPWSYLQVLEDHSYNLAPAMTNFRLLLSATGEMEYLVMDVANRAGATTISAQYQGAAKYGASFGGTLVGTETPVGHLGLASKEGKVGIGTQTPGAKLEVNGGVKLTGGSGGTVTFADGTVQNSAYTAGSALTSQNGNIGIGTSSPDARLTIVGIPLGTNSGDTSNLLQLSNTNPNNNILSIKQIRNSAASDWYSTTTRIQQITDITNQGYMDFNPAGAPYGIAFGSLGGEIMRMFNGGNVGIGTTSSGAKLEVNGNIKLSSGSGASLTFSDGTVQSTAWNGTLCGGDYAESVDVSGGRASYQPGDVLVIDLQHPGKFLKSSEPYSTALAGIYSTKPGIVGRRQTTSPTESTDEVPMAMIGIVPTKVTAENGPIKVGDFIVSSSTPGYAMRGTDRNLMFGAVMGKALGTLETGNGVIEVLVTLQ